MKHVYHIFIILMSFYMLPVHGMGIFDAARDAVEGAAQVTNDTLDIVREPGNALEGAANVTNDALQTTGYVVEDVLHPINGRNRISNEEMSEQEVPFIPEQDTAYMPPQSQEME